MNAELSRLVAGGRHHAAGGRIADGDRQAPQVGIVALFDRCLEGIHVHMHDFALPLAAFVVCHGLASIRTICIAQTWEVRAAFVTLRRLHALAAHRHAPADHCEGHAGAKCFHQQLALKRAVAIAWATDEFDDGFRRSFSFGARSFIGCRRRMRKNPIPNIDLNPLAKFSDGHCRSTSARHMRIDSFSL